MLNRGAGVKHHNWDLPFQEEYVQQTPLPAGTSAGGKTGQARRVADVGFSAAPPADQSALA